MNAVLSYLYNSQNPDEINFIQNLAFDIKDPILKSNPACFGYRTNPFSSLPAEAKLSLGNQIGPVLTEVPVVAARRMFDFFGPDVSAQITRILQPKIQEQNQQININFQSARRDMERMYNYDLPFFWDDRNREAVCLWVAFKAIRYRLKFFDHPDIEPTMTAKDLLTELFGDNRIAPLQNFYDDNDIVDFFAEFQPRTLDNISWQDKIEFLLEYASDWDDNVVPSVQNWAYNYKERPFLFSQKQKAEVDNLFKDIFSFKFYK